MITPTRQRPILTFILLTIVFNDAGRISFVRIWKRLPPKVFISLILSGSVSAKLVYIFSIVPKIATDMAVTIIAFALLPSQTMSIGASADLGRLLRTTRYGSSMSDSGFQNHKNRAVPILNTIMRPKLKKVSPSVIAACFNMLPSISIL